MAVQAQYPSNILLLKRSVYDSSLQLQSQQGGTAARFVDDPHRNQNSLSDFPVGSVGGGGNSTKRRREIDMNQLMSVFHQQQLHNHQIFDVNQLRSRNVDVSTGLRLAFNDQQQSQPKQHSLSSQSSVLSEELITQINQQRDEFKQFLHAQGDELRRALASKRQKHYHALLRSAEDWISLRLKDKEAEVEKAARRNAELKARAEHLSEQSQIWQARARAQEAEAVALQSQLQQAIMSGRRVGEAEEEVGLECAGGDAEDAESAYIDPERVVLASGPGCKACGKRLASVVLLPCRHLCVCTECDGIVSACPLCLSFRSSSIEVYLS